MRKDVYRPNVAIIILNKSAKLLWCQRKDHSGWQFPQGGIDKNESPEETAVRECKEETGCSVNKLTKIFSYFPAPGSSQSYYHFFIAEVESFKGERILGEVDEDEDLLVRSYSTDEVKVMLNEGKIINGATLIALQWFYLNYLTS